MNFRTRPTAQEVRQYLDRRFGQENSILHFIRTQSEKEQLPPIQIPIYLGRVLYLLAKIQAPKQILEIGTLGGYSTACLAQALSPQGRLISLECNAWHAAKAREHLQPMTDRTIDIREGQAVDLLAQLAAAQEGPFDLIFIDADKENNALYVDWSIHLSRPGTLILIDNLIPKSNKVGEASHYEAETVYAFNDYLARHPLIEVCAIPTLIRQETRLDGLALCRVK